MKNRIKTVRARQLLDCKARPVLEVEVETEEGVVGRGTAPTGTSVGSHEAFILRDNDPNEYYGLSVHHAAEITRTRIADAIRGMSVLDQSRLDERLIELDGTEDKHVLGGNSIYSVSIAVLRAAAASLKTESWQYVADITDTKITHVPVPTFNLINGGNNAGICQPFNEFQIAPVGASCIEEVAEIAVKVHRKLGEVVREYCGGMDPLVGGSFGWAAPSEDPLTCISLLADAVDRCGYTDKVAYGLDCASSEMYDTKTQTYYLWGKRVPNDEIIAVAEEIQRRYPVVFIEDLLAEDDWDGFVKANRMLTRTIVIGDDFTVTNLDRIKKARALNAIGGFIVKPNQVGTLTEAFRAVNYAKEKGMMFVPSGRSGGVVDDIVADLNIGLQPAIVKCGVPKSGERLNKLNILLRAADQLGNPALADLSRIKRF